MRFNAATEPDRKSGESRGTCGFPGPLNNGEGYGAELQPLALERHSFLITKPPLVKRGLRAGGNYRSLGCARDDKVKVGSSPEDSLVGSRGLIPPTSLFLSSKIQSFDDVGIIRVKLERFLQLLFALVEISVVAQSQAEVFVQSCSQLAVFARREGFLQ